MLAATFVTMAAVSWYRWPEVIVDYGRELYVPWRIIAGEMLYQDIPHLYGPLAHYCNALLFTIFGTSLRTLVSFNLLLIAALTLGIYSIFRRACGRLAATLCGMVFLGVFAFSRNTGQGNWNFVCPYAHEVTYGISLCFLLVPVLGRFHARGNHLWAGIAGFLLGAIFLTKVEVFVAALAAATVVVILPAIGMRSLGTFGYGRLLVAIVGFVVPPLLFIVLFSSRNTVAEAAGMVVTTVTSLGRAPIVGNPFYRGISGLDAPGANIATMLAVAAIYGALLFGVFLVSRFVGRRGGANRNRHLLAAVVLVLGVFAYLLRGNIEWWALSGRAFPLFVLAYVCRLLWRATRGTAEAGDRDGTTSMIAISVFSFFLMMKIMLNVRFLYYGFALAMPATLVVVAIAAHHLPEFVRRRGGCAVTAKLAATTLIVVFLALQASMSWDAYRHVTFPVGRGADRFFTFDTDVWDVGPAVNEALEVIEATVPEDAGFVVIPEGVMLNYLARRRNPGKWFEFTPSYIASMGEGQMRADLEAARPDYVVLTERPTPEHGARYFGTDYGLGLKAWIMENYTPVHLAGNEISSNKGFGIVIARRNSAMFRYIAPP